VNYESLEFDSVGFEYATRTSVEKLRWNEITDVFYRRLFNDFANQIDKEWEFHSNAGDPVIVLVEWPQKKNFARAVAAHIPGVSTDLVAKVTENRGEGRWRCMQS